MHSLRRIVMPFIVLSFAGTGWGAEMLTIAAESIRRKKEIKG
jgi:hypothetical protein